ncbi:MAG: ArsA family ATPase [Nitrospira sp.]|nr:ArsA family ATPase [Nitrospira sp.]
MLYRDLRTGSRPCFGKNERCSDGIEKAGSCSQNEFFKNRREIQIRYLKEIRDRFNLPMLQIPMLQEEIKGLVQLKHAMINL